MFVLASLIYEGTGTSGWQIALMLVSATALAYCSYALIEQPIRQRRVLATRRSIFTATAVSSAALLLVATVGETTGGFPQRYGDQALKTYDRTNIGAFYGEGTCFLDADQPFVAFDKARCLNTVAGKRNILVVGDSVAAHYVYGLRIELGDSFNFMQLTDAACVPFFGAKQSATSKACDEMVDLFQSILRTNPPDAVIVSANWRGYSASAGAPFAADDYRLTSSGSKNVFEWGLRVMLVELARSNVPVLLFGPSIEFKESLYSMAAKHRLALGPVDVENELRADMIGMDAYMAQADAEFPTIRYISILKALCPDMKCTLQPIPGIPLVWDGIHLTPEGSSFAIKRLSGQIVALLRSAPNPK